MQLIAGHVQAGQVVVLLLDLRVACGVVPVLFLERSEPGAQPLIFPQQLLGEFLALIEQLEKLLSSPFVVHL